MTEEDELIKRSDALKAVDNRHEELLHDTEYRKKHCQIDVLGIKKHILAIPPVEIPEGEWIRKEDVITILNRWADGYCYIEIPTEDAIKCIMDFNPGESYSRPSGEWIKHIDDLFPEDSTEECPFCHEEQRLVGNDDNFCPNCGAKLKMPY